MILEVALLGLALGLLLFLWNGKPPNFPDGPRGLPIIGNLHQLGTEPHKTFMQMKKKYGDIFSIKFGSYEYVDILQNIIK